MKLRNWEPKLNLKSIEFKHADETLGKIQIIWITNIGDIKLKKEVIEEICTNNTIMIISGYSYKKSKKFKEANIKMLTTLAPVYFIWGPKDYLGNYRDLNAMLLDCKVTILENTNAAFETENGTKFSLVGLDDVESNRDNLTFALDELENDQLNILISYSEVINSKTGKYDTIQVYLFEKGQLNVKRNDQTIYMGLNNESRFLKQNAISVINFNVK